MRAFLEFELKNQERLLLLNVYQAKDFDLPAGLGEVLSRSSTGEIIRENVTRVRIVRGSQKQRAFIKTAFPVK